MAFTPLPKSLRAQAKTGHLELVAVVGTLRGASPELHAGVAGDVLHYEYGRELGSWTWGDAAGKPQQSKGTATGELIAVRADGLMVTRPRDVLEVWRGGGRVRAIAAPRFANDVATGEFVHDRLCCTGADGVTVIDVETGRTLHTIPGAPTVAGWIAQHVAPAPDHGVAVTDNRSISIHDLDTGKTRLAMTLPPAVKLLDLALSPDGFFAVGSTVRRSTNVRAGFSVFDLRTQKPVTLLTGHDGDPAGAAFADGGRALVTVARDGSVRAWSTAAWQLLEERSLAGVEEQPRRILAWDARSAVVVTGALSVAYVYSVRASPA